MHNTPAFVTNSEHLASLGQIADSLQQRSGRYGGVHL